jgi:threonyl-tRNA synthetase
MVDLQSELNDIISKDNKFERKVVTIDVAKEMFKYNKYKITTIEKLEASNTNFIITIYKCGDFIDLCHGPHIPTTNLVKSIAITNVSSTHIASIKRIACISFPTTFQMDQYNAELKRREENSHQVICRKQKLFFFSDMSPGSAFFLPHGTRMINAMTKIMRQFYHQRGYSEVSTPNIFKCDLYKISGHYQHYKQNMFNFNCESDEWSLKPMNCPGHCLIFSSVARSYNELPLRFADFGALHRNELSGALHGLTRVRKFCQDDRHIFLTQDQIQQELTNCIDFLRTVYKLFGFEFSVELSTRPDDYAGELELWDRAETILTTVLDKEFGTEWTLSPKNGSFYGPKIDVALRDKFNRMHQCATIQLDFVLPEKFKLAYADENNNQVRPVMIHQAIYGSIERFLALAIENYEGTYPLWLSPRQFIIIPVHPNFIPYCQSIYTKLCKGNYFVDLDTTDATFGKKIALARAISNRYNYIIIIGQKEVDNGTITIKDIKNVDTKDLKLEDFLIRIEQEMTTN